MSLDLDRKSSIIATPSVEDPELGTPLSEEELRKVQRRIGKVESSDLGITRTDGNLLRPSHPSLVMHHLPRHAYRHQQCVQRGHHEYRARSWDQEAAKS